MVFARKKIFLKTGCVLLKIRRRKNNKFKRRKKALKIQKAPLYVDYRRFFSFDCKW